jgi:hypothetical protein
VVDIIDNDNRELVWRGSVTDVVGQKERTPEQAQAEFNEGAEKLLATFPPGSKS